MESLQSRIKVSVVHAGLSQLPESWKLQLRLKVKPLVFQNNNLLTAQDHMETTDATEDGHHLLLIMLKITELPPNLNIHTLLKLEHAKRMVVHSKSPLIHLPQVAMVLLMALMLSQFQSLSMPATGAHIDQEPSTTVLPQSTTLSFWSVLLVETGRLRTLGEHHGEKQVSSDLPEPPTLAESVPMLVFIQIDCESNILYYSSKLKNIHLKIL